MASKISTFSPYNDGSVGSFISSNSNDDYILHKTTSGGDFAFGSGDFTIEGWMYPFTLPTNSRLFYIYDSYQQILVGLGTSSALFFAAMNSSDTNLGQPTSATGAVITEVWQHYAAVRNGGNVTLYVNGTQVAQNTGYSTNAIRGDQTSVYLGYDPVTAGRAFDGFLSDIRVVKGQAVYTSNFTPPTTALSSISGTGYSTVLLAQPGNNANLNRDTAAPEEAIIPVYDSTRIPAVTSITYTNDNTTASITTGTAAYTQYYSNAKFSPSSGKYYFEARLTAPPISTPNFSSAGVIGFLYTPFEDGTRSLGQSGSPAGEFALALNSGNKVESGSPSASYSSGFTNNQVFQFALDTESGSIWFGRDGTWLESGNPTTGANPTYTGANANALYFGIQGYAGTNYGGTSHLNMGQNPTFNGTESPSGGTNSDGSYPDISGIGSFLYEPPTGYKAPSTLVPTRASGLNKAALNPDEYFDILVYEGNGGTSQSVQGLNFKPDLVWVKQRDGTAEHQLVDSVRGPNMLLSTNGTPLGAELDREYFQSFDQGGFTTGDGPVSNWNSSGADYVAWCWKTGGEPVVNTDGTITSMVSANKDAGFSIVSYVGSASDATIGHGLSSAPELFFLKNRVDASDWRVGQTIISGKTCADGNGYYLELNDTKAVTNPGSATTWGATPTNPTSSVFSVGSTNSHNGSNDSMIAHCWHSVPGFSKFGSYTGNGSTDGPFVYLGFRPAWVMVKRTDSADHWFIVDVARDKINVMGELLLVNSSGAFTASDHFDYISNGFKIRNTGAGINASSGAYIFMAFAETPSAFTNSR